MKTDMQHPRGARSAWLRLAPSPLALLCGALLLLGGAPALAAGEESSSESSGEGAGNPVQPCGVTPDEGDESIGSLPTGPGSGPAAPGGITGGLGSPPVTEAASLVLSGPVDLLATAILGSEGTGHLTWSYYLVPGGELCADVALHGDVSLVLHPKAGVSDRLEFRVDIGAPFAGGIGTVSWKGGWTQPFALPAPGSIPIPTGALIDNGLLADGAAAIHLYGAARGTHGVVQLEDTGAAFVVSQSMM